MIEYRQVHDTSWQEYHADPSRIDANARLVASLIDARDFVQLFRRTGIRAEEDGQLHDPLFPIFIELGHGDRMNVLATITTQTQGLGYVLKIPDPVQKELMENVHLDVATARIGWKDATTSSGARGARTFRGAIAGLSNLRGVRRVSVPSPLQPCLEQSSADLEMPEGRQYKGKTLDGAGIVVGIIDDGCALAHRNFLIPGTNKSRIQYLWHQGRTGASGGAGWAPMPGGTPYDGLELDNTAINNALAAFTKANGLIQEDEVYDYLQYDLDIESHGTHVMDIAAGNGTELAGGEGVASAADIVFVQLPRELVEEGGPLLEHRIQDGVQYIFERAAQLGKPAVVNISYGGYSGPHDGSSPLASGIDGMLQGRHNCAVVVSAGNGFEADCHAMQTVAPQKSAQQLHWNLGAEDPTANQLEVWYEPDARLQVSITPPDGTGPLPPVKLGDRVALMHGSGNNQKIIGWIENLPAAPKANAIRIQLNATEGEGVWATTEVMLPTPAQPPLTAPATSGTWRIDIYNYGTTESRFHAWIARDDLLRRGDRRRQQSRFPAEQADARYTIADLATGKLAICVGAHNTATGEACRYSACGPTRDHREKPEVTAPAEEDATHRGVLCASARRAQPTRFNGTSASAPHVAGLVALLMQYNRDAGFPPLTPDRILQAVIGGAAAAKLLKPPPIRTLVPSRHEEVDAHVPPHSRQSAHFARVTGHGKVDILESLKTLP